MRPTLAGRALTLLFLTLPAGCQSAHHVDFVPIDTRVVSEPLPPEGPERVEGPLSRVKLNWRVYGRSRPGEGLDRGPELVARVTCRNGSSQGFTLDQGSLRILDDEGRPAYPDLTDADREMALTTPPGAVITYEIRFRPEGEISLERVGSIRLFWSFRIGGHQQDMETKFFRRSIAEPRRSGLSYGGNYPFVFFPR